MKPCHDQPYASYITKATVALRVQKGSVGTFEYNRISSFNPFLTFIIHRLQCVDIGPDPIYLHIHIHIHIHVLMYIQNHKDINDISLNKVTDSPSNMNPSENAPFQLLAGRSSYLENVGCKLPFWLHLAYFPKRPGFKNQQIFWFK